ncbi:hypothetical protein FPCIR_2160 [Fusarium pseudocircinatum]|uniref:Uncharacterized protein n=1 Tax=Fusarium pseudocircinatum TaxID=56676 RepID=A0A8H5PSN0_9HYPO|nr:hypothetical protein FPCIR_2160 [Fusarium pseudocircinatum]
MEGYDDNDSRCLPRMPRIFTPPDAQPEVVLFSAAADDESSTKSKVLHELATCGTETDDTPCHDKEEEAEAGPNNAPHSTLMSPGVFTIKDIRSSQSFQPSNDFVSANNYVPDETIRRLKDIANRVHALNRDPDEDQLSSSGETTPTGRSLEVDSFKSSTPDQAPQPLTRSRLRSIPDARPNNLGAANDRLKNTNEGSQVATHGSDTPRPAGLDTSSINTNAHEAASEDEHQAYYIFDPRSNGSAYFMYEDTEENDGFKIERVSFKSSAQEPGVRAYYLEASDKDQGVLRHGSHETLWRLDPTQVPAVIIDTESSASLEAEVEVGDPLYAGEEATQSIARKVSDRLQKIRHLREHLHVINGKGQHVPEAKGLYLIGDKDIRDVVSIVLDETLKNGHIELPKRTPTTTGSSDSRPLPRLDENLNAILVPSPMAIDPATTINLPSTSYTNINATDMQVHTKTRGGASEATTTVVTRRSIAEITWSRAYPANYDSSTRTHCRTVSDCCSPTHGGSRSCPDDRRQSYQRLTKDESVLRHYATPKSTAEILADIMCNKSFEQQLRVSDGTVITSFPRLFSRDCTTDLTLQTESDQPKKRTPSTLYQDGVDTHCGVEGLAASSSSAEPSNIYPYNNPLFAANPFRAHPTKLTAAGRRLPTPLAAERKLSASLDADTRRRLSAQVAGIEEEEMADSQNGSRQSLMDKIKQGGHKLFHKNHFRKPTGGAPIRIAENDISPGGFLRSRDSIAREPTPEPPKANDEEIYEAMEGSKLKVPHSREGACSEDNQPHECVNDLSSRDISPK